MRKSTEQKIIDYLNTLGEKKNDKNVYLVLAFVVILFILACFIPTPGTPLP